LSIIFSDAKIYSYKLNILASFNNFSAHSFLVESGFFDERKKTLSGKTYLETDFRVLIKRINP